MKNTILKIKISIAKNITWVYSIVLFSFFVFSTYILTKIDKTNTTILGTYSAILGAIIGGIFTLLGTILVTKKQLMTPIYIDRKNTIYNPLYNELLIIQSILDQDSIIISFQQGRRIVYSSLWSKIKNDSRYFELDKDLKKLMEELATSINEFLKICEDFSQEVLSDINTVLINHNISQINDGNFLLRLTYDYNFTKLINYLNVSDIKKLHVYSESFQIDIKEVFFNIAYDKKKEAIKSKEIIFKTKFKAVIEYLKSYINYIIEKYEK